MHPSVRRGLQFDETPRDLSNSAIGRSGLASVPHEEGLYLQELSHSYFEKVDDFEGW